MAPREDLIASAVSFLQDPSVASSPLAKRIDFLRAKNLTQEEINIALSRAGANDGNVHTQGQDVYMNSRSVPGRGQESSGPGYGYGYGPHYAGGPWMQTTQEPPRRDWRDWFIMATVTSGIGWGLYTAAQRYVVPLVRPPTPPQLEQDKAAIDASFDKAFALIEQLATDTAELKAAETARTEKIDAAMENVAKMVTQLQQSNAKRERDSQALADQVTGLKELVPASLATWKKDGDGRLEELAGDLASLKRLLENRVATPAAPYSRSTITNEANSKIKTNPSQDAATRDTGVRSPVPSDSSAVKRPAGRASIPAWQMASSSNKSTGNENGSDSSNGSSQTPAAVETSA